MDCEHPVVGAFLAAARDVPAYKRILDEAGVDAAKVRSLDEFRCLVPIVDKKMTFGSFPVAQLCRHGQLAKPTSVLTSSGHSGQFAFGIYDSHTAQDEIELVDDALDMLLSVRSRTTLLINCLPMGVQVQTRACTLAQTSVRADMVTALVKQLGQHYEQIVLIGETAFIKHVLELGQVLGIDWQRLLVHVIVGEEPLAENARKYLADILATDAGRPETGLIASSMGVAELGLNLFLELPELIVLRRTLHEDPKLREAVFGNSPANVPMLFTYDARRVFVEILDDGELVLSTLDTDRRLPLVRYRTGDIGAMLTPQDLARIIPGRNDGATAMEQLPIVAIQGRGKGVWAGAVPIYPEQVKEGLYYDPTLARMITANFRLSGGVQRGRLRIQLSPDVADEPALADRFAQTISRYVPAPLEVKCQTYESFGSGMALDYERKFAYIEECPD